MKMTSLFSLKQSPMRRLPLKGSAALVLVLLLMSSATGDQHWKDLHSEVQRGDVVPLETILDWLDAHYMGDVLEIEVERDDGLVEYEIKLLGPQGQVVEFEFDGQSGQLMQIEGVRIREMQR
ncbi:hypothetical protein FHJ80_13920 [Halomonas sp. BL6]|jgi:uncharacterized membrane protein YkoI|nr:hypothetical protein FHJ80_13920 [Halomonas sp. BL6]|tara:strand:- start:11 stop:376 length:366 start_codon:yes stop_codon:yes gene_type:complete